jgi:broad specificity phosphatase PhoE
MAQEKEFVFIRHARGIHQKEFYLQENGKTAADNPFIGDSGLSTEGHEQATLFGNYFRLIGEDTKYTNIFCSPIRRCIETCDHIVKEKDIKLFDELMEVNTIQRCNNKHKIDYLTQYLFVKRNRYNLDNINDTYNPDRVLELKYKQGFNFKEFQNSLQVNLKDIFQNYMEHVETKDRSGNSHIDIKEVLVFKRIYDFIERTFDQNIDKPLVFTHGEWIQCLNKLYLKKNIDRPLNCEVVKLTLKKLDPLLIEQINLAIDCINTRGEQHLDGERSNLVQQTQYFKKYLKYKKKYLKN